MPASEPLVVIGGTLCDGRVWAPTLRSAGIEALSLVAGEARAGADAVPAMVDYAAALLSTLPPRFSLAGFSLGGLIALEMIAQQPQRIARLALVSAGAGPETPEGAALRCEGEASASANGLAEHVKHDLWPRYNARGPKAEREILPLLITMAEAVGRAGYKAQNWLAISRADSRPRLAGTAVPTLLVGGSDDLLCPPIRHIEIGDMIPSARQVTLPDCGHFVPLEQPHLLGCLLRDWLG